jgi:tetratricopeptide (TPR) repeat protein
MSSVMREPTPTSLCSDQRRRWREGDRIAVEAYLARQPALEADAEAILDLIYNEVVLREQHGERPRLDEYLERFPRLASELGRQFEVHQAIDGAPFADLSIAATIRASVSASRAAAPVRAEGAVIAGYEVLDELGRGGMGVVYRARQASLNRCVALKMIRSGAYASAADRARFRREAEAVARLQHPNIVHIHEIGEHDGLPFFALELVNGPSLAQAIGGRPQPPAWAATLVETLARAIQHAHEHGIVHRDLKPANILLQSDERRGAGDDESTGPSSPCPRRLASIIPRITDFGAAKVLDGTVATATGELLGTPSYMAPEQATGRGDAVGPGADVYALGAILYELLTGRPPFDGAMPLAILHKLGSEEPVPPGRLRAALPRDLETICLKCLEKQPGKRYAGAVDLADDLHRFLVGEPIRARPAGRVERVRKWARRRPAVAALLGVSCAALVVLGLLGLWHRNAVRDREQQSRTDERQQEATRLHTARAQYQQFLQRRDETLFYANYGTVLADADWRSNVEAAQTAARAALALAGITPGDIGDPVLDPHLSDRERREIVTGCHQTLLALAEAVACARPDQSPEEQRRQTRRALDLLDQARGLAAPGPAFHRRRARYLVQLGDGPAAEQERARATGLTPASATEYFLLACEWFRDRDYPKAMRAPDGALRLQPDDFWSHFLLACCDLETGSLQDAETNLAECLAQRPRFVWAHLLRSTIHEQLNRLAEAEADCRRALALEPNEDARFIARITLARVHGKQGKLDEANTLIERARRQALPARAVAKLHVEHGRILFLAEKYEDAVQACDAALRMLPGYAEGHQVRGQALLQLARYAEAAQAFDHYLANGGNATVELLRGRGRARFQAGDYLGARDDYTQVVQHAPDTEIFLHRGWAYYFADAYKAALRDFQEAVQRDANNPDAYVGRGLAQVMLGEYRAAMGDASAALRLKPQAPEMMHNVACIYALAMAKVANDPAALDRRNREADCRAQAIGAIRATLALIPTAERARFWQEKIAPDPALDAIRGSAEFAELDALYNAAPGRAATAGKLAG